MTLARLQLLSFEIGTVCNYAPRHPWCPASQAGRHRLGGPSGRADATERVPPTEAMTGHGPPRHPLTDEEVLRFAAACYGRGFRGLVCWHYYNEPMLHLDRILRLGVKLRGALGLGMGLWTNGSLIDETFDRIVEAFDRVWISAHCAEKAGVHACLRERHPDRVQLVHGGHDDRLDIYGRDRDGRGDAATRGRGESENETKASGEGEMSAGQQVAVSPCRRVSVSTPSTPGAFAPCYRPSRLELPVDHYGELHLCCADWRAEYRIGNVQDFNHEALLDRWEEAAEKAAWGELEICGKCRALRKSSALEESEYKV